MPTKIDKTNPEWASRLAEQVREAKVSGTDKVSDAFAHLAPLIEAVGTTEAQIGQRFKIHAITSGPGQVFVTISEAGVSQDITLYQQGDTRLAGAASLSVVPRDRLELIRGNLRLLVDTLEDVLVAKATALIDEASW